MTRREAEALLARAEGRLCVRFYARADGTILTENCPVGLRRLKRRLAWVWQALLGMLLGLAALLGFHRLTALRPTPLMGAIALPVMQVEQPVITGPSSISESPEPRRHSRKGARKKLGSSVRVR